MFCSEDSFFRGMGKRKQGFFAGFADRRVKGEMSCQVNLRLPISRSLFPIPIH
jgi:hypothetical protein